MRKVAAHVVDAGFQRESNFESNVYTIWTIIKHEARNFHKESRAKYNIIKNVEEIPSFIHGDSYFYDCSISSQVSFGLEFFRVGFTSAPWSIMGSGRRL
jgi:hypothetical protein